MPKETGVLGRLSSAFRRKHKVDLVVGLDFGTSSTKAAYRELGSATRKVTPILFEHGLNAYPSYCLPSVGVVTRDRRLVWGPDAIRRLEHESWSSGIRRLKVLVAGEYDPAFRDPRTVTAYEQHLALAGIKPETYRPEYLAAFAIAKQMHVVRNILEKAYKGADLDIRFNICVPIDHLEHSRMVEIHRQINLVAEELYNSWIADGWGDNELVDVAASKFDSPGTGLSANGRLFAMPEAMAEIASYLGSLETRQGIHAVIDIGAGTTDLSIFNLFGPTVHQHDCYWYAARNVPRGTGYVEAELAKHLTSISKGDTLTEGELLKALDESGRKPDRAMVVRRELEKIWDALRATWTEGYRRHYKKQSAWENIPVFVCGGGAKLAGVKEVFARAWVPNFNNFSVRALPVPDDYDGLRGTVPFDRLSVAYGLTFLSPELGDFSLPSDSPDHTPVIHFREFPLPWTDNEPG
jgi:hypothetical protein